MLSGGKDQIACTVATSVKVTGLKATALSKGRIQLKWTGYPTNYKNGYSRYVIEYKTSAKGAYKRLKLSGDSNGSYTLKSLKKGKTYYFRIRSYVKDTNSYVKAYSSYSKVLKIKAKYYKIAILEIRNSGTGRKTSFRSLESVPYVIQTVPGIPRTIYQRNFRS